MDTATGDRQNSAPAPWRASYAADPAASRGRLVAEPPSATRTEFQRDRDRILHSTAFRRLAHKTQVFVPYEGDHYRTRLTHTIEVSQIARAISRVLGLDDDLAEALALGHDLGHTPFGHTGEDVLDELMTGHGGFDHNAQALRIVTKLEHRYAAFDGLNLTWEALEGLVKHNGPLLRADGGPAPRYAGRGLPVAVTEYAAKHDLSLASFASAEAQAAALADDIAYNAHDLDDGLRAGLFDFADLAAVDFLHEILRRIEQRYPDLERPRRIHEVTRRVIAYFIEDAIAESRRRLTGLKSAEDVRAQSAPVVGFSEAAERVDKQLKLFLLEHMYRHPRINGVRVKAAEVIRALFPAFLDNPGLMPGEWALAAKTRVKGQGQLARLVCDYIAGMTDRYALAEHQRLFDVTPELR
ncbi:MAG TPA: deoxyguanosinetriphosphate triphosphohydrolase [Methylovirgula sp.]|nr:deoxyguanosinetriphosphate triphosphohydrolase [Methylovirgula sp.]